MLVFVGLSDGLIGGSTPIDVSGYQNSSVHIAVARDRSFDMAILSYTGHA